MQCQAIDPDCQEEATRAVKMTRGLETKIQYLCQRHFDIGQKVMGPYPQSVIIKNPWGDDEKEIFRAEEVAMPLQGMIDSI